MLTEYFQGYPLYFLDIVAHNLILELFKDLITLYLANRSNTKKNKLVLEFKEKKFCEALNTEAQFMISAERDYPPQTNKKEAGKIKFIPTVRSFMVFKICEALGLEVELNTETEFAEFFKQQKKTPTKKEIPIVKSLDVFKLCQALGINAALAQPGDLNDSI
ncbi:hypothetical protein TNCT_463191 [Trichonephila clavata]|uniref:Uncharacterized protein n=1 Tax=Trichonephila clavata TaxID=2740835 RepID=A0A8X6K3Q7_TRICU|nr:hypothetical protein TNCT_463191 [Trichonephila clavata]